MTRTYTVGMVSGINSNKNIKIKFLVDSGSDNTTIKEDNFKKLGTPIKRYERVETGNGFVTFPVIYIKIKIPKQNEAIAQAWIVGNNTEEVLGITVLEAIGLSIDTKNGKLVKRKLLMY